MTPELPDDIARTIFIFIRRDEDRSAFALANSSCLSMARESRFARITLSSAKESRRFLQLLRGDIWANESNRLTSYIRELRIVLWPIRPGARCTARHSLIRPWTRIQRLMDNSVDIRITERMKAHVLCKYFTLLSDILSTAKAVHHMSVTWDGQLETLCPQILSLLTGPSLACFSTSLVELVVQLPVERLKYLASCSFRHLADLQVGIYTGNKHLEEIRQHLDGFVVFLNNCSGTLTSLAILCPYTSIHLDVTYLFEDAQTNFYLSFSSLRFFALSLTHNATHLGDIGKLRRFLARHTNTITRIQLQSHRLSLPPSVTGNANSNDTWLKDLLSYRDNPLLMKSLDTIEMPLRPLHMSLDELAFAPWLAEHIASLTSLTCTGRYLKEDELGGFLEALGSSPSLQCLDLMVAELNSEVLERILQNFPNLKCLVLCFSDMTSPSPNDNVHLAHDDPFNRIIDALGLFRTSLSERDFQAEKLEHLALKCKSRILAYREVIEEAVQHYFPGIDVEMSEDEGY